MKHASGVRLHERPARCLPEMLGNVPTSPMVGRCYVCVKAFLFLSCPTRVQSERMVCAPCYVCQRYRPLFPSMRLLIKVEADTVRCHHMPDSSACIERRAAAREGRSEARFAYERPLPRTEWARSPARIEDARGGDVVVKRSRTSATCPVLARAALARSA